MYIYIYIYGYVYIYIYITIYNVMSDVMMCCYATAWHAMFMCGPRVECW